MEIFLWKRSDSNQFQGKSMLKILSPIPDTTIEALRSLYRDNKSGFYPFGANNFFHGGLHLYGDKPVQAIADGTIIAYRMTRKRLIHTLEGWKESSYSNSFVLIRHQLTPPEGDVLTFFSLYMHLLPLEDCDNEGKEQVKALGEIIPDKLVSTELPVQAGMAIGYPGYFAGPGRSIEERHFHFEVFCKEAPFLKKSDTEKEKFGKTTLTALVGSKSKKQVFPHRIGRYRGMSDPFPVGTELEEIERSDWGPYVKVRSVSVRATEVVKRGDFAEGYAYNRYTFLQKEEIFKRAKAAFSGYSWMLRRIGDLAGLHIVKLEVPEPDKSSKFAKPRLIRMILPEDERRTVWLHRDKIGDLQTTKEANGTEKEVYLLDKEVKEYYTRDPDVFHFVDDPSKDAVLGEEFEAPLSECHKVELEGENYWRISLPDRKEPVWLQEDGDLVSTTSVFNWPGFELLSTEQFEHSPSGFFNCIVRTPFLKELLKKMEFEQEGWAEPEELNAVINSRTAGKKLEQLICEHPSEWYAEPSMDRWDIFDSLVVNETNRNAIKKQRRALEWWDQLSEWEQKQLPDPKQVKHFHPVGFLTHMERIIKNMTDKEQ